MGSQAFHVPQSTLLSQGTRLHSSVMMSTQIQTATAKFTAESTVLVLTKVGLRDQAVLDPVAKVYSKPS